MDTPSRQPLLEDASATEDTMPADAAVERDGPTSLSTSNRHTSVIIDLMLFTQAAFLALIWPLVADYAVNHHLILSWYCTKSGPLIPSPKVTRLGQAGRETDPCTQDHALGLVLGTRWPAKVA